MKRTRLKDIAQMLNTSTATVSRALKDSPEISEGMKMRVKEVAQLLDYKPNHTALTLKIRKSYLLGVIFPDLSNMYMSSILVGLLNEAAQKGYKMMIAESNYDLDKELGLIGEFYDLDVDAVMILPSRKLNNERKRLEGVIRRDVPFLVIDRAIDFEEKSYPFISSDDYVGSCEGMNYLISKGYKRIAHLKGVDSSSVAMVRYRAYADVLVENGVEEDSNLVLSCRAFTTAEGRLLCRELMALPNPPDAFFCINDPVAIGVLDELRAMGLKVPEDVGVLGFSNSNLAEVCSPRLSSIHQPGEEVGREAIKLLLSHIEKGVDISEKRIVLKTHLIRRESC